MDKTISNNKSALSSTISNISSNISRELSFALRDRVLVIALVVTLLISSFSIIQGLHQTNYETELVSDLESLVTEEREITLSSQSDAGSAAYYAFHFSYDAPSSLAFTSRGVRDELPWKHRLRMLAIEGQIYESDTANPALSRIGQLDFAFIAAFILPLLCILLLYDLRAAEVRNKRWDLISATNGNGFKLLRLRAVLRSCLVYLAALAPFLIAALINGAQLSGVLLIVVAIALNIAACLIVSLFVISRVESGPTAAAVLLGIWFVWAVAIPVGGKLIVDKTITVPQGGELLLAQREKVNGAWDLPKAATMMPFLEQYPEWINTTKIERPFEWKWYYAFQQMGDHSVAEQSELLRSGIRKRDNTMALVALASPALLTERLISNAADTTIASFQRYDACVREFHKSLREFHYPMLFGDVEYSAEHMLNLPMYKPCS